MSEAELFLLNARKEDRSRTSFYLSIEIIQLLNLFVTYIGSIYKSFKNIKN